MLQQHQSEPYLIHLFPLCQCRQDWASIGCIFAKEEDSRHSPSTSSNLTSLLSPSAKTQSGLGTLAVFGPEMRAPRHIITSTRATFQHRSAILYLFYWNYDFRNTKKLKKNKNKIEKMSEEEAKGLWSELGTLAAFLALNPSNKKQSPKKEDKTGHVVASSTSTLTTHSSLSPIHHTADVL